MIGTVAGVGQIDWDSGVFSTKSAGTMHQRPTMKPKNAEVGQRSANYDIGKDIKNLGV